MKLMPLAEYFFPRLFHDCLAWRFDVVRCRVHCQHFEPRSQRMLGTMFGMLSNKSPLVCYHPVYRGHI